MNFADFTPGEALHPSPEHILRNQIALGQAFINENFHFKIVRGVGPSWQVRLAIPVGSYEYELFALEAVHVPHECTEDIAGKILDSEGFVTETSFGSDHTRNHRCDFLKHIRNDSRISEQFQAVLKRPWEDFLSRQTDHWINISTEPIYRIKPENNRGTVGRHFGFVPSLRIEAVSSFVDCLWSRTKNRTAVRYCGADHSRRRRRQDFSLHFQQGPQDEMALPSELLLVCVYDAGDWRCVAKS